MRTSMQLDRLSTWNEVSDALSFSPLDEIEPHGVCATARAVEPAFTDGIALFDEEFAWLAFASKVRDLRAN
jgi:hypothetical protein